MDLATRIFKRDVKKKFTDRIQRIQRPFEAKYAWGPDEQKIKMEIDKKEIIKQRLNKIYEDAKSEIHKRKERPDKGYESKREAYLKQ